MEQMLVLAKSHKGKAAEVIISKIISKPNIFKFGEFLNEENIKQVSKTKTQLGVENKHYKTLELFAYGNFSTYLKSKGTYIDLDAGAI